MTRVFNNPEDFREEVIAGFSAAYGRYVRRVEGASGFIRRTGPLPGRVSLVVGGGSGHYPSYAGIVGSGLAAGCVLGDIFTSPSVEQVYRVASAAAGDSGVVLSFGNYAGDRLNFAAAQERLITDGIDTRIVYVTDDIASAPPQDSNSRRGIAGTLTVYKIGGAAADDGYDLDSVERVMQQTNAATFSLGAAFAGCTFPGQSEPLFHVETGKMELGLGIHGEPGIETVDSMSAQDLSAKLVLSVLAERPSTADGRAAVIVNGLGATKYEELFVLYGSIHEHLEAAGVDAILPEVGEFVTSLDMAGCSLSVTWLDDELARLWSWPVDTASFRRGVVTQCEAVPAMKRSLTATVPKSQDTATATVASKSAGKIARAAILAMRITTEENEKLLGDMDAVAGDGDHGVGMVRGFKAAANAIDGKQDAGIGTLLRTAGDAFGDKAGGTSGILWGILLSTIGDDFGDIEEVHSTETARAVRRGANALQTAGKASLGDKTMLDALFPFVDEVDIALADGFGLAAAWQRGAKTATIAAANTASLVPKVGRARPLANKSIGNPDPGAVSMALLLNAVGEVLSDHVDQTNPVDRGR